jgi:uncharacterized phage-associated protein
MIYNALDIAKYIINYEHSLKREISNLRLQKILYFVQVKFLVTTNKPCFSDNIEAWAFGPVVAAVYHKYKIYGSLDIFEKSTPIFIDKSTINLMNNILESCALYPTYQLVEITHNQDTWKNAYSKGSGSIITQESIIKYFKKSA